MQSIHPRFLSNGATGLPGHVTYNNRRQNWDLGGRRRLGSRSSSSSSCSVGVSFPAFERRVCDGAPRGVPQQDAASLRHVGQLNSNQLQRATGVFSTTAKPEKQIQREATSFLERLRVARSSIFNFQAVSASSEGPTASSSQSSCAVGGQNTQGGLECSCEQTRVVLRGDGYRSVPMAT